MHLPLHPPGCRNKVIRSLVRLHGRLLSSAVSRPRSLSCRFSECGGEKRCLVDEPRDLGRHISKEKGCRPSIRGVRSSVSREQPVRPVAQPADGRRVLGWDACSGNSGERGRQERSAVPFRPATSARREEMQPLAPRSGSDTETFSG